MKTSKFFLVNETKLSIKTWSVRLVSMNAFAKLLIIWFVLYLEIFYTINLQN